MSTIITKDIDRTELDSEIEKNTLQYAKSLMNLSLLAPTNGIHMSDKIKIFETYDISNISANMGMPELKYCHTRPDFPNIITFTELEDITLKGIHVDFDILENGNVKVHKWIKGNYRHDLDMPAYFMLDMQMYLVADTTNSKLLESSYYIFNKKVSPEVFPIIAKGYKALGITPEMTTQEKQTIIAEHRDLLILLEKHAKGLDITEDFEKKNAGNQNREKI